MTACTCGACRFFVGKQHGVVGSHLGCALCFNGLLRMVTDLSAAPAADTISVDKRTGGGTVERGGLTVCVYACVCAAAGVAWVYVLLKVIFYCLNYSI